MDKTNSIFGKKKIYLAVICLFLVALYILPIPVVQTVDTTARILPLRSWTIARGKDGRLIAILQHYGQSRTQEYSLNLFERGDAVKLVLNPEMSPGQPIAMGDTLGYIYSNEIDRDLARLRGNLAAQKASLLNSQTGEKSALVEMAQQELEAAVKEEELQKAILDRKTALYNNNLISIEEFENEKTRYEINRRQVAISRARLAALSTGQKPEYIAYLRSQITALQNEIEIYQRRRDSYLLKSPISGQVMMNLTGDTLVQIQDRSQFVSVFPVEYSDLKYIDTTRAITILSVKDDIRAEAKIFYLDNQVNYLNKRQVVMGTARISPAQSALLPGMVLQAQIKKKPVLLRSLINRFLVQVFWQG